jgi:hypothetical protein
MMRLWLLVLCVAISVSLSFAGSDSSGGKEMQLSTTDHARSGTQMLNGFWPLGHVRVYRK